MYKYLLILVRVVNILDEGAPTCSVIACMYLIVDNITFIFIIFVISAFSSLLVITFLIRHL